MATSKVSAEERMLRKRHAARLRQQRCRARKRQALIERQVVEKVHRPSLMNMNVAPSENRHPNHRVPPRFVRPPSPRSVYYKESQHWPTRYPSMNSERPRSWSYDSPHMDRYDAGPVKPGYSRYSPPLPPRVLMPQFSAIQQPQPRYFSQQQLAAEREKEYFLRRIEQENEYRQQQQQQQQASQRAPWSVKAAAPRRPVPQPRLVSKQDPIKTKEEAAVDAILSLKGGEIVAPPKIKRFAAGQDDGSAFKSLQQQEQRMHREARPGFYLTMRVN